MESLFLEKNTLKQVALPADLNAAPVTGARIKLDKGYRCAVKLSFGDSTGAAVTVSFQQHDAATGGNSKAVNVQTNYYVKAGAATSFTKTEIRPDDAGLSDSVDLAAQFGSDEGLVVFEFLPEFLDVQNGFAYLSVNVADSTAAKVMAGEYIVCGLKQEPAYLEVL
jgi:hypothetical protein